MTSMLIGPMAQWIVIPFMTTGAGVSSIGPWFGTGKDRGLALIFVIAGITGLVTTATARSSTWFAKLIEVAHAPVPDGSDVLVSR